MGGALAGVARRDALDAVGGVSVIHYHGTPITPLAKLQELAGRSFCVSWFRPEQVARVHEIGESIMLDNGAYSHWRRGCEAPNWEDYYRWVSDWLVYPMTWAVIPDVVAGTVEQNDALLKEWPHGHKGAPVWHLHEPIDRFVHLCREWPRVCVGSSGNFSVVGSAGWHGRMTRAFNALCPGGGPPSALIHMLRGMQCSGWSYPFASVDSTDIAVNSHRPGNTAEGMARRWGAMHCPPTWTPRPVQLPLLETA